MRVIGLTGGIGSGKSLAAQYFAELGAFVVDADQLAREAIERGSKGFDEVVSIFGDSVLLNGDINRSALAELVFKDSSLKLKLEALALSLSCSSFESDLSKALWASFIVVSFCAVSDPHPNKHHSDSPTTKKQIRFILALGERTRER